MKPIVVGGLLLLGLGGIAGAADLPRAMPVKAPLMAAPVYDWAGFYGGFYYGSAVGQSEAHGSPASLYGGVAEINKAGFTGGVTAGYNWQMGPAWLVGLETDLGYLGLKRSYRDFFDPGIELVVKPSWYATVRARVGHVTGPSLLYVTGGAAFVGVEQSFGYPVTSFPTSHSGTETGWTAGGGIETKLSRNWSTKTEYLYIDAGRRSFIGAPYNVLDTVTFDNRVHVIKTGFNYKFGGPAEPLPFFSSTMLAPAHNWAGFYAGANVGGGLSTSRADLVFNGSDYGQTDINGSGLAGGLLAGYNFAVGSGWLAGIEADIGYLGIKHSFVPWNDEDMLLSQKTDWYGTVRGRVGRVTGPAFLYFTGGAAFAKVETGYAILGAGVSTGSETAVGWAFGGGTEVALNSRWSAKLESLYIDLGRDTRSVVDRADVFNVDVNRRFTVVRAGLNYRFGDDAVSARY